MIGWLLCSLNLTNCYRPPPLQYQCPNQNPDVLVVVFGAEGHKGQRSKGQVRKAIHGLVTIVEGWCSVSRASHTTKESDESP